MSIKIDRENYYYIPNENKHSLSLYNVKNLYEDDFEIMVRFKVDWRSFTKHNPVGGVVVKNGMHMGIFTKKDYLEGENYYYIVVKVWVVENGNNNLKELKCEVDKDLVYEVKLTHNKELKQIIYVCNDYLDVIVYNEKICDYKNNMLWYGCSMGFGNDWNEHFHGELIESYISIKDNIRVFETTFDKVTEFKVFDESEMGNHLINFPKESRDHNTVEEKLQL